MKILFIGDIFSKPGMEYLALKLPELKQTYKPNIIIANAENVTNGRGINLKAYKELMGMGVSACTMGNWVWSQKELAEFIDDSNIIRPFNYRKALGKGYLTLNFNGQKLLIINALGRTFMNPNLICPFTGIDEILKESDADYVFVDFHAEATSEKMALAHYLDGRVSALVGTHTHVQTSDERVLPKGTLYITDVGMTGPYDGVIGVDKDVVIDRFINGHSVPAEYAKGKRQLNAVLLDLKKKTIERIQISE